MAGKVHVRRNDVVYVLTGKDKGKKGKVLKVFPSEGKVLVEGVNIATKHRKPRKAYEQGGIIHQEAPIDSSNVMLVCSKCDSPAKVGKKILENGEKVRMCKRCGEIIDVIREPKGS